MPRRDGRLPDFGGNELDEIQAGLQRLAAEHGRLQELLNAVLAISSHLELEEVLHTIVEAARELVQARYAAVGVLDDRGQFTELITSGFGVDQFAEQVGELPHGTGLLGDLVRIRDRCGWKICPPIPAPRGFLQGIR